MRTTHITVSYLTAEELRAAAGLDDSWTLEEVSHNPDIPGYEVRLKFSREEPETSCYEVPE